MAGVNPEFGYIQIFCDLSGCRQNNSKPPVSRQGAGWPGARLKIFYISGLKYKRSCFQPGQDVLAGLSKPGCPALCRVHGSTYYFTCTSPVF